MRSKILEIIQKKKKMENDTVEITIKNKAKNVESERLYSFMISLVTSFFVLFYYIITYLHTRSLLVPYAVSIESFNYVVTFSFFIFTTQVFACFTCLCFCKIMEL